MAQVDARIECDAGLPARPVRPSLMSLFFVDPVQVSVEAFEKLGHLCGLGASGRLQVIVKCAPRRLVNDFALRQPAIALKRVHGTKRA